MRNTVASLVAAVCLFPVVAFAQDTTAGKATGQLVIGDKIFPLTVTYANLEDDVEHNRSNGPQKSLTLLFADDVIPPAERTDWFALSKRTCDGKLHAVQLHYDPVKKELFGSTIFYVTPDGKDSPLNITMSGGNSNVHLDNIVLKDGMISGTAKMVEPEDWRTFAEAEETKPRTYTYSVAFSAPIVDPIPVTANLTGKAAQTSPQVVLSTQFFKACYVGDLTAIRVLALPNAELEGFIKKEGVAKVKVMLKQFAPPPAAFAKAPKHVIVRGDSATVIAGTAKSETGSMILKMVRKNGKWIVSQ